MTDVPKRIWAQFERTGAIKRDNEPGLKPVDSVIGSYAAYDLARPGQPCSTDEFLERVMNWPDPDYYSGGMLHKISQWLSGDFVAAMEGLE